MNFSKILFVGVFLFGSLPVQLMAAQALNGNFMEAPQHPSGQAMAGSVARVAPAPAPVVVQMAVSLVPSAFETRFPFLRKLLTDHMRKMGDLKNLNEGKDKRFHSEGMITRLFERLEKENKEIFEKDSKLTQDNVYVWIQTTVGKLLQNRAPQMPKNDKLDLLLWDAILAHPQEEDVSYEMVQRMEMRLSEVRGLLEKPQPTHAYILVDT